ncbi:enoyl-CoA hydratase-related protein [Natronoglycomyces albus]|uniref:Formyl transferase n=1 Tax=Natronoglycomyces albus TaxID=2811108 RepID=A0A895XYN1_9ACTN|nr:enoyl-CoA hydratase-related protein [Natronoglycomyces albus]QSB06718.1 formyl transferase [Natronoglycomyces albus]
MKILLLVSAFNGLTQRVWCDLRDSGHEVGVELAATHESEEALTKVVADLDPDLILCPFLKHRVPEAVWRRWTTVIVHPGPAGDRGPSSLDHAIMDGRSHWGVTALQAVEEMDAGPIWSTINFAMPNPPVSKSALYNSAVADAAMLAIEETIAKVTAGHGPTPVEQTPHEIPGTGELPLLRRAAFALDFNRPAPELARIIAAADGSPGATGLVNGEPMCLYDGVATAVNSHGRPGETVAVDNDAVAIACAEGTLWVGYAARLDGKRRGPKLPAAHLLQTPGYGSGHLPYQPGPVELAETTYHREGDVGFVTIRSYSGAMHTGQCHRLYEVVRKALNEDTKVLVLQGTEHTFSNGVHLGVIDAAPDPAVEAWANITAINDVCRALADSPSHVTVAAFTANAGAGGAMMGLAADVAVARDGVVLNPYYDMGLYGSELHTYSVANRLGDDLAQELLAGKQPISAAHAAEIGLIEAVGPRSWYDFHSWLVDISTFCTTAEAWAAEMEAKRARASRSKPLDYYETLELAEMARDFFDDRNGFARKRHEFLRKVAPTATPDHLRPRW